MKTPFKMWFALLPIVIWAMTSQGILATPVYAASSPLLGSASSYSVVAGTSVTNSNATTISGDVGISPGATPPDYSGFGSVTLGGTIHDADGAAASAISDAGTAYNTLNSQGCDTDYGAVTTDLAGKTLTPGVYCSDAFTLTGSVTLSGNSSDVWVFKSGGNLSTVGSTNIVFTGGSGACNVWWYVPGTVSLDAGSSFAGTIIANSSISLASGASLNGRIFSTTADVTLDGNSITGPTCGTAAATADPSSGSVAGDATSSCTPGDIKTVPTIIETKRLSPTSISVKWGPYEGFNTFIVAYGLADGKWDYNTKVTGFTTTLNDLPANQSIWVHVAATDNCAVGQYGASVKAGGAPGMPNTGFAPKPTFPWLPILSFSLLASALVFLTAQIKRLVSFKR